MIELVFSACLVASPMQCKEVHMTFGEAQVTPVACMMNGQIHMAEWSLMNPKWRVGRFKCQAVREARFEI